MPALALTGCLWVTSYGGGFLLSKGTVSLILGGGRSWYVFRLKIFTGFEVETQTGKAL